MKKYIKAVVFLAVMIVVIYWAVNRGKDKPDKNNDMDNAEWVNQKCTEIRDAWQKESGWNKTLYSDQKADIKQDKQLDKTISDRDFQTVFDALCGEAATKTYEGYNAALADYSNKSLHQNVTAQYDGIKTITDDGYVKSDDGRIKKIKEMHNFYIAVKKFVESKHNISAPNNFAKTKSWKSFSDIQNGLITTANGYLKNPLFSKIENIPNFKAHLQKDYIIQLTNPYRMKFYNDLSNKIIDHFKGNNHNVEDSLTFIKIYENFSKESGKNGPGLSNLATFKEEIGY